MKFPKSAWDNVPAFYEQPILCTLLVKMSYSSTPSVWWSCVEVDLSDGFQGDINWPIWHTTVSQSHLHWLQCKVIVIPWCPYECFCPHLKSISPFLFPLLAWKDSISFLETTPVKLLNKRATGLYSIPWLLQHTPVPPAISCWCSAFFNSGWIGQIVYKDGSYVKLT